MKRLLYLTLVVLPFGKALRIPLLESNGKFISLFPFDVLSFCLAIACAIHYWKQRHAPSRRPSIASPVTVFILWSSITLLLNAIYFHLHFKDALFGSLYLLRWIEYIAFYYAAVEIVTAEPAEASKLLKFLFGGALAFSIFGIIQSVALPDFALLLNPEARPYIDYDPQGHRLVSTFLDPNITAAYILFFAILALSFYMNGRKRWLLPFLTLFVALVLTLSRGGALGFLMAGAALMMLTGGAKARRAIIIAAVVLVVLAAALYQVLAPQLVEMERFSISDHSAMMRIEDWLVAISIVHDNPVMGIGFNTFGFISPMYGLEREGGMAFGFPGDLLLMLTLTGIVGLFFYLRIYWKAFFAMRKLSNRSLAFDDRPLGRGLMAGMIGLLVSSCFTTVILYPEIMAVVWTLIGIVYSRLAVPCTVEVTAPVVAMSLRPTLYEAFRSGLQRRSSQSGIS